MGIVSLSNRIFDVSEVLCALAHVSCSTGDWGLIYHTPFRFLDPSFLRRRYSF